MVTYGKVNPLGTKVFLVCWHIEVKFIGIWNNFLMPSHCLTILLCQWRCLFIYRFANWVKVKVILFYFLRFWWITQTIICQENGYKHSRKQYFCWHIFLFDLRGSGLIQRSPRPCGWSSPRPTPRWLRTSWLAPPTPLPPSRVLGHSSLAETHVSPQTVRPSVPELLFVCVAASFHRYLLLFEVSGQLFPF